MNILLILLSLWTNPILPYDYSDPDAIRVGKTYYMVSSTFQFTPGLPVLASTDLAHWRYATAAIPYEIPDNGSVWAPSIRFHKGRFYIYYGDPDHGIYCVRSAYYKHTGQIVPEDIQWEKPVLVCQAKGYIDPCPLWTKDGRCFLAHAFAGSRAGFKSAIAVMELSEDGLTVVSPSVIAYDGHEEHPTIEGPKLYYRNGYYYLFCPAGGVTNGWQLCLRSTDIYGPYEVKRVLEQGATAVNGPHQGAWVDDYFIHFQDVGQAGRIVHIQPLQWHNDWPVIGDNGTPVDSVDLPDTKHRTPNTKHLTTNPAHWSGNFDPRYIYENPSNGSFRLFSFPVESVAAAPNLRLRRIPNAPFVYTAKVRFCPNPNKTFTVFTYDKAQDTGDTLREEAGLVVYGRQTVCLPAPANEWIWLRVTMDEHYMCQFYTSQDNVHFLPYGEPFPVQSSGWSGARVGWFCIRNNARINDSGWLDVENEEMEILK